MRRSTTTSTTTSASTRSTTTQTRASQVRTVPRDSSMDANSGRSNRTPRTQRETAVSSRGCQSAVSGRGRGRSGGEVFVDIRDMRGRDILSAVKRCRQTGSFVLKGLGLSQIPNEVLNYASLPSDSNDKWWEFEPLLKLDMSENQIHELPAAFKGDFFHQLTFLSLSNNLLSDLPDLSFLCSITFLDISFNNLSSLPLLDGCQCLTEIRANDNDLAFLPDFLPPTVCTFHCQRNVLEELRFECAGLRFFNASNNKISHISRSFFTAQHLEEVDLSHNELSSFPKDVSTLKFLQTLDVSFNKLNELDCFGPTIVELHAGNNVLQSIEGACFCHSLKTLDVHDNLLSTIPDQFQNLTSLTRFDVSNNELVALPAFIGRMQNLSNMSLTGNHLKTLARLLDKGTVAIKEYLCTRIEEQECAEEAPPNTPITPARPSLIPESVLYHNQPVLSLISKNLYTVPPEVFTCTHLTSLDLSRNALTGLPQELCSLRQLDFLNLERNKLETLPSFLSCFTRLTAINISQNPLHAIPDVMGQIGSLRELFASSVSAPSIPLCLLRLSLLSVLDVSGNKISTIPPQITFLSNLSSLDISNNDICNLPPQLGLLSLNTLNFEGNIIKSIPRGVIDKGTPSVLAYLKMKLPPTGSS
ncbi:Leucine-rich repeat [Pelomyxa schiedti]|nr:Leucine-rich repeat [Pelomyxa schiedti]